MAFLEFKNVRIAGISAGVPKHVVNNLEIKTLSSDYDNSRYVEVTGVRERRIDNLTVSDLGIPAAQQLLSDLKWDKNDVGAIIFVSQNSDYILPATACIIQHKLGLGRECYALDISMGCSGWVYGLSATAALISESGIKKALLIAGDAKRRAEYDDPLFGYAATATALEYDKEDEGLKFHFGTDGSGFDAIIIPDGGARNPVTESTLKMEEYDGKIQHRMTPRMKGMDVFAFGITTVPKSIKLFSEHFNLDYMSFDWFVFHQANLKMNNQIVKKLKIDAKKVPQCMDEFGNTSSASIPLTIVTRINKGLTEHPHVLACGFGVGLSWGTVAFRANKMVVSKLVEL